MFSLKYFKVEKIDFCPLEVLTFPITALWKENC